jgi:hypothetical protein
VLASLLLGAELGPWELSEIEQRNLLTVFVQQRRGQGRRVVVVIDDAHTFADAAWEEIERLLAFRIDGRPAIELLLAGPPSLTAAIDRTRGRLEASEIYAHPLESPSQSDLISYVEWRLARFDMAHLVTPVASQMLAGLSAGRYAAIDVLCQMSLLVQRQLSLERVDARVARRAVAALHARQGVNSQDAADTAEGHERLDVPPQGYLLVSRGGQILTRVTLGQRTLLGRSEHNDVCLPSPYLSRHHAVIVGTPEGYYVVDLNSVNGLALNGRLVERAVLYDQDVITIGPFRMKVQIAEWLTPGNPLPEAESLIDTAVMPAPSAHTPASVRRVK